MNQRPTGGRLFVSLLRGGESGPIEPTAYLLRLPLLFGLPFGLPVGLAGLHTLPRLTVAFDGIWDVVGDVCETRWRACRRGGGFRERLGVVALMI